MNPTDVFTIQAFTAILPRLELVMSDELKQAVHETGRTLAQHEPSQAADRMRDLVSHHRCLKDPYIPLYERFEERFPAQATPLSETRDASDAMEPLLERMTVPILTSETFAGAARDILKRVRHQTTGLPEPMHLFIIFLKKAVATFDDQINAILKGLEQQLLSAEDIAVMLNVSPEQANRVLQMLWDKGYIDSANQGVIGRAFAVFGGRPNRALHSVAPDTHFVLTSKGHFHLHPLRIARRSEGELE